MLASVRAGLCAALIVLAPVLFSVVPAHSAEKTYQRDYLADLAIKLEGELKKEAASVAKPTATLRREADEALARRDVRSAVAAFGQLAGLQPADSGSWLRYARAVLQTPPPADRDRSAILDRAATALYLAYQRAGNREEEAESLAALSRTFTEQRLWRPALDTLRISLELREVAERRVQYEQLRAEHGFRILDYTVDSDAASPRVCFQFSEDIAGKRTDLSPFVALGGVGKPALTSEERQLCVEGLRHGERYSITLRAGLPSSVKEAIAKSADYNIYVRDRKPFVRFTSKAYVLPRNGQQGIPLVSVNTDAVEIRVLRVGDRNLMGTVLGRDFQRNLDRYDLTRIGNERGVEIWKGEMAVERTLNADVTTAFPVEQAVGKLAPGVYVMAAEPKGPKGDDDYATLATQWFIISDLGLAALSGNDGVHVFVQSLASTALKPGVEVRLLARSNEVLATRTTDAAGRVHFEAGLTRGEGGLSPAMVVAAEPSGDYAFLNLKGSAFDLSDRGVAGRAPPNGLDAFVYPERGVYRTGETVHVTALLRDAAGVATAGVPLTLIMERSDGVEYRRTVAQDQGLGGRSWSVPITGAAPTGAWKVRAHVDPKGPAVGEAAFLVEDYVPDRLEFDLAAAAPRIARGEAADLTVRGRYLYGAPASALGLDGEVVVSVAKERPGFPGYQFGLADEEFVASERQPLENLADTDVDGNARISVALEKVPATTRPLEAKITVRMAESGGRAVERNVTLPVAPAAPMIGIKPLFSGKSLGDGEMATFDVAVVSPDGRMSERRGLRYDLVKVETRYQWFRRSGYWEFEPVKTSRRIADGRIDVAADKPGRISAPVTWGRYRLEVATDDPSGPVTSIGFDAGFYAESSSDTPDLLEIALDKAEYRAGEPMTVAVTARTAGKVTVNVVGDRLIASTVTDVQPGTAQIPLTVGADWGAGAYVVATLHRPLEEVAKRMPGRAIGVQWFSVDRKARTLALDMKLPDVMRPNTALRIPVTLTGLPAGEEARIAVAAVDVGILNLTNYKPPAPDDYYFGQRKLSAELRDLYGQLIDGMQGTRGQIRTGGDGAGAMSGAPPTQAPLAFYSGVVSVGPDGRAEIAFDIPAFAGSVRVMAVAWSRDKVGRASGDVVVRDPVVLTATLPRFLLSGDQGGLRLEVDNVEGQAGDYRIEVATEGPLSAGRSETLRLAARQRSGITLPLNATGVGSGRVSVQVSGPGGFELGRSYPLTVRPATQVLARRTVKPLARGESLTLSSDMFADLAPGTGSVSVSVGPSSALDVAALLQALDRYPFGCSEQIASRAMPLLYVNELAAEQQLALDTGVDQKIRDAIERLLARQGGTGSFGLWATGGDDAWLDAYVTDFLTRARERGFVVPDVAFRLAIDRLRNFAVNAPEVNKDGGRELAYVLYVLARNGVAPIGDLRYIADTKLADLATPIAKAQIAAALGLLGDRVRAERVYAAALSAIDPRPKLELGRTDYGSALRDSAALVTLASEGGGPRPTIVSAVQRIEAARGLTTYTSTQEQAWLVLAARALGRGVATALDVDGERRTGPYYRQMRADDFARTPLRLTNAGEGDLQAVVSVSGSPLTPEPAAERGFKIERNYFTLDGEAADPRKAKQNQRFVVVLKITEPAPQFERLIVADYLPAGFEIDNPKLVSSGETGTLDWIEDAAEPVHSEFRDDRFTAAFQRKAEDPAVFAVAYVVRAVSPGRYLHPQAYVEDMYRPDRFGRTGTGSVEIEAAR